MFATSNDREPTPFRVWKWSPPIVWSRVQSNPNAPSFSGESKILVLGVCLLPRHPEVGLYPFVGGDDALWRRHCSCWLFKIVLGRSQPRILICRHESLIHVAIFFGKGRKCECKMVECRTNSKAITNPDSSHWGTARHMHVYAAYIENVYMIRCRFEADIRAPTHACQCTCCSTRCAAVSTTGGQAATRGKIRKKKCYKIQIQSNCFANLTILARCKNSFLSLHRLLTTHQYSNMMLLLGLSIYSLDFKTDSTMAW